jgi:hypothetical protein
MNGGVDVGGANAAGHHLYQNFLGSNLGNGDLLYFQRLSRLVQSGCFHHSFHKGTSFKTSMIIPYS